MAEIKQKGPRMAETAGKPPPEGVEKVAPSSNSWERLLNDWQKRPKAWITYLVVAAVVALAALIAFQYFGSRTAEKENERADLLNKALSETDPAEQAARLDDLRDKVAGTGNEAYVLWLYASKRKEAGDLTEVPEEKLAHYEKALEAAESLRTRFPGNPLVTLPWRPVQPAAPPAPSLAGGLEEYCKQQISWLRGHPASVAEEADAGASGKIVLADPDGKEHTLDLKFFSKDAPYAVDVFFELAKQQVYDGTLIHGLERDDPNTEDNHAVHLGSALSKFAPEKPEDWGGETDYVGFTAPKEDSRLKTKKGRLAMDVRREGHAVVGLNPVAIVISVLDPKRPKPDRTVFAEVSGEPEVLATLSQIPGIKDKPLTNAGATVYVPEKTWKVVKISVEGQPAHPPAVPLKWKLELPKPPKPEPPKEDPPKEEPKKDGEVPPEPAPEKKDGR